jgi:hypothetical protein
VAAFVKSHGSIKDSDGAFQNCGAGPTFGSISIHFQIITTYDKNNSLTLRS